MKNKKEKPVSVGGQALMEGIMMRGPKGLAMSLRLPDGSIETSMKNVKLLKDKFKPFGWPFIRGIVGFVESMILGYTCLMESAEKTSIDITDDKKEMSKIDIWFTKHFGPKMMTIIGTISAVLGFALAFLLFFWLPSFIFDTISGAVQFNIREMKTIFEGIIRIIIFVAYMAIVAKLKDIKRLYMYHGAEHKSIFCFENGEELTVENVRKQKRFHPRCGTSFIFVMIILSILISSVVAVLFKDITLPENRVLWITAKLLLVPVIMGIGFEFIRYAGCHQNIFVRVLSAPGLWMQRITTQEPTDDIIEVGIAALKAVLGESETIHEISNPTEPETDKNITETEAAKDNVLTTADEIHNQI